MVIRMELFRLYPFLVRSLDIWLDMLLIDNAWNPVMDASWCLQDCYFRQLWYKIGSDKHQLHQCHEPKCHLQRNAVGEAEEDFIPFKPWRSHPGTRHQIPGILQAFQESVADLPSLHTVTWFARVIQYIIFEFGYGKSRLLGSHRLLPHRC